MVMRFMPSISLAAALLAAALLLAGCGGACTRCAPGAQASGDGSPAKGVNRNTPEAMLVELSAVPMFTYLGKTEDEARQLAAEAELPLRVVRRDGQDLPTTRDLRPGRLNVHLLAGRVAALLVEQAGGPMQLQEGVTQPDLLPFIGQSAAASEALADEAQRPWRIVSEDGEGRPATMDYRENRVNVWLVKGMVVAASDG